MKPAIGVVEVCCILSLGILLPLRAEDASIDRLLSKLPPPEKIIKPSVQKALQQPDPAFKDALAASVVQSFRKGDFSAALKFSRKLVERYPRSDGAQILRGIAAYDLRQFGEATASFQAAINIEPRSVLRTFWYCVS